MPNYCYYEMDVAGYRDNVYAFLTILKNDYNEGLHFYRVFEASPYDWTTHGVYKFLKIFGHCAWSVYCCMFKGNYTYYGNGINQQFFTDKNRAYATHILEQCKRLNLSVEIKSHEPGIGFQEDYLILGGILAREQESPYYEFYFDEYNTFKEYCDDIGHKPEELPFTEQQFYELKADCGYYATNIKENDSIPYPPQYLCKQLMYKIVKKEI